MYQPLTPCPSCRRHVRAADGACPFCRSAIDATRVVPSAGKRLARGAVFVFATSAAACGGSTEPEPVITETGGDTSSKTDSVTPIDSFTDTALDTGNVAPPYGIPPDDTGVVPDGTVDDSGGGMPKYGAPPTP
jgi:hypothetical protein